ncbi:glutathione S-transferase 6 [Striga asiatica]|uniref:Glutathione S-transferase 6 n=1 Tax=Striga asiatica TaxID=4170 RepID=A0A5A7PZA7_STRAF|nr:glutathione S-transferase 6 [Striga asiatica]
MERRNIRLRKPLRSDGLLQFPRWISLGEVGSSGPLFLFAYLTLLEFHSVFQRFHEKSAEESNPYAPAADKKIWPSVMEITFVWATRKSMVLEVEAKQSVRTKRSSVIKLVECRELPCPQKRIIHSHKGSIPSNPAANVAAGAEVAAFLALSGTFWSMTFRGRISLIANSGGRPYSQGFIGSLSKGLVCPAIVFFTGFLVTHVSTISKQRTGFLVPATQSFMPTLFRVDSTVLKLDLPTPIFPQRRKGLNVGTELTLKGRKEVLLLHERKLLRLAGACLDGASESRSRRLFFDRLRVDLLLSHEEDGGKAKIVCCKTCLRAISLLALSSIEFKRKIPFLISWAGRRRLPQQHWFVHLHDLSKLSLLLTPGAR